MGKSQGSWRKVSAVEHVFDKAPMSYINNHRKRSWQEGKAEGYEDKFMCSVHNQSLLTFSVHNGHSFHLFGRVLGKHNWFCADDLQLIEKLLK